MTHHNKEWKKRIDAFFGLKLTDPYYIQAWDSFTGKRIAIEISVEELKRKISELFLQGKDQAIKNSCLIKAVHLHRKLTFFEKLRIFFAKRSIRKTITEINRIEKHFEEYNDNTHGVRTTSAEHFKAVCKWNPTSSTEDKK